MDLGFKRSHLYASIRIETTWEERPDKPSTTGQATGFLVRHRPSDGVVLVTNRHVVDPSYSDPAYRGVVSLTSVTMTAIFPCNDHEEHHHVASLTDPTQWTYPDGRDDVAVRLLGQADLPTAEDCTKSRPAMFAFEQLADTSVFHDPKRSVSVEPGDLVAVSGYPEIGDQLQERPVALFGFISSDPAHPPKPALQINRRPMQSDRVVLYQGFSRSGASGSPILAVRRGLPPDFIDKKNAVHRLGMMMQHDDFSPRHFMLIGINGGRAERSQSEPSALSYFIRSDAIRDAISNLPNMSG